MKDDRITDSIGHTSPPPGLVGADLIKWVQEKVSARGFSRNAEFSANQQKIIKDYQANKPSPTVPFKPTQVAAIPVPEKLTIPVANSTPEATPIGGKQFDHIPLKMPGEWEPIRFGNDNPFRQLEGRRPKDEAELAEKINELFQLEITNIEEYKFAFQATRMVRGFFLNQKEKAFKFHEKSLSDCLLFDDLLSYWDQVKLPCWLVEGIIQKVPTSWHHPCLKHPSGFKSNTRQLAGVAYCLQAFWGNKWFRMYQEEIASLIDVSQQQVSNCLHYLCKNKWLKTRPVKGARCNEYRCLTALKDAAQAKEQ